MGHARQQPCEGLSFTVLDTLHAMVFHGNVRFFWNTNEGTPSPGSEIELLGLERADLLIKSLRLAVIQSDDHFSRTSSNEGHHRYGKRSPLQERHLDVVSIREDTHSSYLGFLTGFDLRHL